MPVDWTGSRGWKPEGNQPDLPPARNYPNEKTLTGAERRPPAEPCAGLLRKGEKLTRGHLSDIMRLTRAIPKNLTAPGALSTAVTGSEPPPAGISSPDHE